MRKRVTLLYSALSLFLCLMICVSGCGAGTGSAADSSAGTAASQSAASTAAATTAATTTTAAATTAAVTTTAATTTTTTTAATTTAAPPEVRQYQWDGTTFELTDVTEKLGVWESRLKAPEGKYVMADFTITDGRFDPGRLDELIVDQGQILLDGHAPATMSAEGIKIEDNTAYAVGTIHVFFDVPKDLDITRAEVTVNEDIPEAAGTDEEEGVPLEEGAAFRWGEYEGSVVKTAVGGLQSGMFILTPAGMTDNDYCFDLFLNVDKAVLADEALEKAFYEAALLTDKEGNTYAPGVTAKPSEGADYLFLYAIPKTVPEEDLRLVFQSTGTKPASGSKETENKPENAKTPETSEAEWKSTDDSLLAVLWESLDPDIGIHMEYIETVAIMGESYSSHYSVHALDDLYYSDEISITVDGEELHVVSYGRDGVEYKLFPDTLNGTSSDWEGAADGISGMSLLYMTIDECVDLPEMQVEQRSYNDQTCTVEIFELDEYITEEFWFDPDGELVFYREIMSDDSEEDMELVITDEFETIDTDVDMDLLNLDLSEYSISKGSDTP